MTGFVLIGRLTHEEGLASIGTLHALWPFLVALGVGWAAVASLRLPFSGLRAGALLWLLTLCVGMGLRAVSGQGTALPFLIVATRVLGGGFLGWRLVGILLGGRAAGRPQDDRRVLG